MLKVGERGRAILKGWKIVEHVGDCDDIFSGTSVFTSRPKSEKR